MIYIISRFFRGFVSVLLFMVYLAILVHGGELTEDMYWEKIPFTAWHQYAAMYASWAEAFVTMVFLSWKFGAKSPLLIIKEFFFGKK